MLSVPIIPDRLSSSAVARIRQVAVGDVLISHMSEPGNVKSIPRGFFFFTHATEGVDGFLIFFHTIRKTIRK